jgi:hypothetical protein
MLRSPRPSGPVTLKPPLSEAQVQELLAARGVAPADPKAARVAFLGLAVEPDAASGAVWPVDRRQQADAPSVVGDCPLPRADERTPSLFLST